MMPRAAKYGDWITYLPEVEFIVTVQDGVCDTSIGFVQDADGNRHFLRIGRVVNKTIKTYLPIGIVRVDQPKRVALIELPAEADSGTRRLWVPFERLRTEEQR